MAETPGPNAATTAARTRRPDPTPVRADRQSRAVPAARTMVVASTASTAQARKTATNSAPEPPVIPASLRALRRPDRAGAGCGGGLSVKRLLVCEGKVG